MVRTFSESRQPDFRQAVLMVDKDADFCSIDHLSKEIIP
jgi:hypothetical protein